VWLEVEEQLAIVTLANPVIRAKIPVFVIAVPPWVG
jgi:hypothetical protein